MSSSRNVSKDQDFDVLSQSPLVSVNFSRVAAPAKELRVVEDAFLSHINIRGDAQNKAFMQAVEEVLGTALPTTANTALIEAQFTVLWYGPSEWLLITGTDRGPKLLSELHEKLEGVHSLVTDISGGNTVIDISGNKARDLLKKATTIDMHPTAFATGACALTTFAHAAGSLYQYDDAPGFRVVVRRSFADYIGTWLMDAAREFEA